MCIEIEGRAGQNAANSDIGGETLQKTKYCPESGLQTCLQFVYCKGLLKLNIGYLVKRGVLFSLTIREKEVEIRSQVFHVYLTEFS